MQGLARECQAKGYKRIDLNVLDWNPARGFYERIGFVQVGPRRFGSDDCMVYRLERDRWRDRSGQ